jgi:hypothetical protein
MGLLGDMPGLLRTFKEISMFISIMAVLIYILPSVYKLLLYILNTFDLSDDVILTSRR